MVKKRNITGRRGKYKRKYNKKKNGAKRKKGLNKTEKKQTKAIAMACVKGCDEIKYLTTGYGDYDTFAYTDNPQWSGANQNYLTDITDFFQINEGTGFDERIGDQVMLRTFTLRFRITPRHTGGEVTVPMAVLPAHAHYPSVSRVDCYLLKVQRSNDLTAELIDQLIPRPLQNNFDYRHTDNSIYRKQFKIVHKFTLPMKWTTTRGYIFDSDENFAILHYENVPVVTYKKTWLTINSKTLYDNDSNNPKEFDVFFFARYGNFFHNLYTSLDFPTIDIWKTLTYTDS